MKLLRYIIVLLLFVFLFLFFSWWGVVGYIIFVLIIVVKILYTRWKDYKIIVEYGVKELDKVMKNRKK